ncbi:MAG: M1 family peptidase [Chitinophagaceae bacterium]|nr:MAG: M1 family peptidase [Chitinophagaceae bacterium]
MKNILPFFVIILVCSGAYAQQGNYWQQKVDVNINASLNDKDHSLDADLSINYKNNSPDTLRFIWFHLWPNAYKNDRTAFSDQLLENGRTDFYFSKEEDRGYINRLNFKVDEEAAVVEDHPEHQDIVKLLLPKPLAPGAAVEITTPFHVKLPYNFSRGGHIGQSYQLTQWYPKPAVYDRKGWHPMPYLDQGEFYSEFGDYKIEIKAPKTYKIAATGKLAAAVSETMVNDSITIASYIYKQENVHDFAWFADKEFEILQDTMQLGSRTIDLYAYYHPANSSSWKNSMSFIKSAVRTKSTWLGEYPYDVVSVVEHASTSDMGGMEYPTITLISSTSNERMLDYLINHEVGHNWFYAILGSNERQHPWMDEGMNSYYDKRYSARRYNNQDLGLAGSAVFLNRREPEDIQSTILATLTAIQKDQPIETPADKFSSLNNNVIPYEKTAQWFQMLEENLGTAMFDSIMQRYYTKWKFKHPYPEDFQQLATEVSGKDLSRIFSKLTVKGSLVKAVPKQIKLTSFFNFKSSEKYHYISFAPAVGYNFYDKFMLGALVHNFNLPPSRLQFYAVPLYATGSKQLNGLGKISYNLLPGHNGQQLTVSVAGARFTVDHFKDSTGKKNFQPASKIVPAAKFVFAKSNPRSTVSKSIQWKTFLISETGLSFRRDTSGPSPVDVISYPKESRYVNQLEFRVQDDRVLYPYTAMLQGAQGKGFVRTDLTINYFFNYATGGGLNVRMFAGKFFYTGNKTFLTEFETDRYHLNMTGPKGYEDYNYQNYFYGRNEFEGAAAQQIMIRDGAFKVRTDLLSNKIGKTDDWLAALNFTTSIPKKINPLEILPIKLPLKLFADVGTYAEAWETNSGTPKLLYDAGVQLSLLKNTINIYVPLLYSKVYDQYFKSTITEKRFVKNISFSIDVQQLSLKKLIPQLAF